jgi:hypothetical protein
METASSFETLVLAYFLNMEAAGSFNTVVTTYVSARCYSAEVQSLNVCSYETSDLI